MCSVWRVWPGGESTRGVRKGPRSCVTDCIDAKTGGSASRKKRGAAVALPLYGCCEASGASLCAVRVVAAWQIAGPMSACVLCLPRSK